MRVVLFLSAALSVLVTAGSLIFTNPTEERTRSYITGRFG